MPKSRKKKSSGIKSGFIQAIISLLIGILITYVIGLLVNHRIIPSYSLTIYGIFNIVSNLLTIRSMRSWGIFYTIGWLAGSFIFLEIGLLETLDFVLNIIVPVAIVALRLILWTRKRARQFS